MDNYRNQRRMQVRLAIKPHGSWVSDDVVGSADLV